MEQAHATFGTLNLALARELTNEILTPVGGVVFVSCTLKPSRPTSRVETEKCSFLLLPEYFSLDRVSILIVCIFNIPTKLKKLYYDQLYKFNSRGMPKIGLSDSQWRQRLQLFAEGKFDFGRGHRPRKGSDRAKELERVEKCPRFRTSMRLRGIQCYCGYHQPQVNKNYTQNTTNYVHIFHMLLLFLFNLPPCHLVRLLLASLVAQSLPLVIL